jgi:catechol 2,3-dioxygenase-like lactoylglutathione lyase family enzyme
MDFKLEMVNIPVTDLDRAKDFYTGKAGFNLDHDIRISPTLRVIQLTPTGSACSIGLGMVDAAPGSAKGMQLVVDDITAARAELLERGVAISTVQHFVAGRFVEGPGDRWNSFAFFDDPDGNSWTVQERPAD